MKTAVTILAGLVSGVLVAVAILAAFVFVGPYPASLGPSSSPSAPIVSPSPPVESPSSQPSVSAPASAAPSASAPASVAPSESARAIPSGSPVPSAATAAVLLGGSVAGRSSTAD